MTGSVNRISALALLPLLLTTVGCRYDGSFLQMDSNAPFPFFGLQLSVDSGSRPTHRPQSRELHNPLETVNIRRQGRARRHTHSHQLQLVSLSPQ